MCCGKTCLKSTGLIFLTTFTIISIAEIVFGTYMLINMYKINRPETLGEMYIAIPSLSLILFGIALLPLIILGCCGYCKEVACCVNMYSAVLLVLSILQILIGVFAIITFRWSNAGLIGQIQEDFKYSFKHFQKDPLFLNTVQKEMHCCGHTSPANWANQLPSSCCGDNEVKCEFNSNFLYENGCTIVVVGYVVFYNLIIGYASVVFGALEVLVTILGFSLGCGSFKHYNMV
ncbi:23 kDa integral membrane protein-like [Anoplophora glabripennis]|uniref:23 kDa integral membrane protein-like n=1 Tax=Anoplophora glabripennis TaxID=217634 RepID=UPI00087428D1|nr:23 kDa integral membrane protein-like [Anoplophora glabripennis]